MDFRAVVHVEQGEPPLKPRGEEAGQFLLVPEIDNHERATRPQIGQGGIDRSRPGGNHRQAVGKKDRVERLLTAEHPLGVEVFRQALPQHDRRGTPLGCRRLRHALGCRLEHLVRGIEAVEHSRGWSGRQFEEIAGGAAAHFQRGGAGRCLHLLEHPIPAEQVIAPGDVVDVPRHAVHAVHRHRLIGRLPARIVGGGAGGGIGPRCGMVVHHAGEGWAVPPCSPTLE